MIERVILLSGPVSSGKSTLARGLAQRYNMSICKTSQLLQRRVTKELSRNRKVLQSQGDRLDRTTHGRWVLEALSTELRETPITTAMIVDSVRRVEQIQAIREAFGPIVIHVHLTAPLEE
ncbi:MAG: (d)CMP kinase, partial [Candidatus Omnitrophica bacterium]|nr:(d)CMP kinase [Candidatus Omnitrophota bacterium]